MDYHIVRDTYKFVLSALEELGVVSSLDISLMKNAGKDFDELVNVFYSDSKYSSGKNYYELFVLPNGYLFISEPLIEEILSIDGCGLNSLVFLMIREIAHLKKRHTIQNILSYQKYGDLKK